MEQQKQPKYEYEILKKMIEDAETVQEWEAYTYHLHGIKELFLYPYEERRILTGRLSELTEKLLNAGHQVGPLTVSEILINKTVYGLCVWEYEDGGAIKHIYYVTYIVNEEPRLIHLFKNENGGFNFDRDNVHMIPEELRNNERFVSDSFIEFLTKLYTE